MLFAVRSSAVRLVGLLILATLSLANAAQAEEIDFGRDIRPILSNACFRCHGPSEDTREADLRLDSRAGLLDESVVVPGDLSASELIERITTDDPELQMPPAGSERILSEEEIELLKQWVEQGAPYELHWSFVPRRRSGPPAVATESWIRNPIDQFILARLDTEGLSPSPEADRATLIRRLTLDLNGLPPTPEEVDAFLYDNREDAYERLVDRLLATPHYGEQMALAWLDASRYADTHGYHVDSHRDMWMWRDWVIEAFNGNMPFDQFATEQLAGDMLPEPTISQQIATGFNRNHGINFEGGAFAEEFRVEYVVDRVHTTSTVFMGLTMKCARCHDHKFDPISQRDYYKFFALFNSVPENGIDGAFGNAKPMVEFPSDEQRTQRDDINAEMEEMLRLIEQRRKDSADDLAKWETSQRQKSDDAVSADVAEDAKKIDKKKQAQIDTILAIAVDQRTDEQRTELRDLFLRNFDEMYQQHAARYRELKRQRREIEREIPTTMVMRDMEKPRPSYVLNRGQFDKHGDEVNPGLPSSLPAIPEGEQANRLGLARWLTDPSHPLTARVTVNRFWQQYFGSGIVKTAENFGSEGALPTHPALLDWLATEFIDSGWNVKQFQRLIVTSATYRQASRVSAEMYERDPENLLLARGSRYRLPAEIIRDNALAISGLLVPKIGGPSVLPYQPEKLWDEVAFGIKSYSAQVYVQDHGEKLYRRGMYTFWKRSCPPPALSTLDAPEREVCMVRRERTNTPLQALVLLNDPTFFEASRVFAQRIMTEGGDDDRQRIRYAFRRATARFPTAAEQKLLSQVLESQQVLFAGDPEAAKKTVSVGESSRDESLDVSQLAAWTIVARIILNLDETISKG